MSDLFINQTNPLQQLSELQKQAQTNDVEDSKFGNVLNQAMEEIDHLQNESHQEIEKVLGGDITDVHSAMIVSITKVYPPPCHQGNSPTLGVIIISSLSGFVGFGWENFSQPVASWEV